MLQQCAISGSVCAGTWYAHGHLHTGGNDQAWMVPVWMSDVT